MSAPHDVCSLNLPSQPKLSFKSADIAVIKKNLDTIEEESYGKLEVRLD